MLKAIVFDFDGIIADSEPLHYKAFLAAAQEGMQLSLSYEEYTQKYIGYDDRDSFRILLGAAPGTKGTPEQEEKIAQLLRFKAAAFHAVVETGIEAVPGILPIVRDAAREMPIAIASGATRADIDLILDKLHLASLFTTIVSANDVEHSKPHPASYLRAVIKLGARYPELDLKPEDCLAIEDTPAGIASAKKAGLMTLAIATTNPFDNLKAANRVIRSAEEITLDTLKHWY